MTLPVDPDGPDRLTPPLAITTITPLLERAQSLASAANGSRVVLGLSGAPGAGKTTVAQLLVEALGEKAVHVPMDGYHLADVALHRLGIRNRKGAPETFDAAGYRALLERIRGDEATTIYAPAFDRDLEQPVAGSIAIEPEHRVVVSEGNYLLLGNGLWARVAEQFDEIWYLVTDQQLRYARIVARHIEFGKSPAFAAEWVQAVDEHNARLVEASRPRAHLVVDVTRLEATRTG